jgi:nitrite reductase/ring-hydroxylating ferredoxin subunit
MRLCALADIEDGGSVALSAEIAGETRSLAAVRQGANVYVYINACPHRRLPLDFKPGKFLTHDGEFILCTNHAALFRITDGLCVGGPCVGQSLEAVPVRVQNGEVMLIK